MGGVTPPKSPDVSRLEVRQLNFRMWMAKSTPHPRQGETPRQAPRGLRGRPPGLPLPSVPTWDFRPPGPLGLRSSSGPAAAAAGSPALSLPSTPLPVPDCHQELAEGSTCQVVVLGRGEVGIPQA